MKTRKDKVKEGCINFLKLILIMIVFNIITILIFTLTITHVVEVGSDGRGFLPITLLEINEYIFYLGIFIFCIFYSILWNIYLKKYIKKIMNVNRIFKVLVLIIFILFIFTIFCSQIIGMLIKTGLFGRLENISDTAFGIFICYPLVFTFIDILSDKIQDIVIKRKNKESKESKDNKKENIVNKNL